MLNRSNYAWQRGLTLLELTVVLLILIALAGLVVPYVGDTGRTAMCQVTDATMQAVKEAIMGGKGGSGFYGDTLGFFPAVTKGGHQYTLHFLFSSKDVDAASDSWTPYNPKTAVGWHGPYLMTGASLDIPTLGALDTTFETTFNLADPATAAYVHINMRSYDGADPDTTATVDEASKLIHVLDGWHRSLILQVPYYDDDGVGPHTADFHPENARLVSAGPGRGLGPGDAAIDTKIQTRDAGDRNDDRVLFLRNPDPLAGGNRPCDQS